MSARLVLILTGLALCGCGKPKGDGLTKYEVTGQVLVNAEREKGVGVAFENVDPTVKGNAARPVAMTGPDGRFTMSTNGTNDGTIAGEYIVTFFWPQGGTSMRDFMDGKYADPKSSKYRITIGREPTVLEPFELEVPKENVEDAHRILGARSGPLQ